MGNLTKPFSVDELKPAVWDCDSFKSLGPDGINFGFIKNFWNEMKDDVVRFITEFHRNGKLSNGINSTFIALIPKVESPQSLNEFRPVSLGYLEEVMVSMSFPTLWRKWIKECVCTATTSVLVNGLNVLMQALVEANIFTGYKVGGANLVVVSHLQFADDTLLIGNKSWANVRALRAGLVLFEAMSGLKVNFHKSSLVGVNINASWLSEAASVLGCKVGKVPFLYLGLPIGGDPRRLLFWEPVVNRIKSRFSGWHSRFLSFGGRLILLKSVLTALPVYALSFFKAPS
ncbi:hypothetical protein MTR_1350s0010, partial [Medicago truncatula]